MPEAASHAAETHDDAALHRLDPGSGIRLPAVTRSIAAGASRSRAWWGVAAAAGITPEMDEDHASAGARSAPASLLHPRKAVATGSLSPSMQRGRAGGHRLCPRRTAPFVPFK